MSVSWSSGSRFSVCDKSTIPLKEAVSLQPAGFALRDEAYPRKELRSRIVITQASLLTGGRTSSRRRRSRGRDSTPAGKERKDATKAAVGAFVEAIKDATPVFLEPSGPELDLIKESLNGVFQSSGKKVVNDSLYGVLGSSGETRQLSSDVQLGAAVVRDSQSHAEEVVTGPSYRSEFEESVDSDWLWQTIRDEARQDSEAEPALASFLYSTILAHKTLERSLAFHIGNKLSSSTLLSTQLFTLIADTLREDEDIRSAIRADIIAVKERDPACVSYSHCILNFKGFQALQAHRVAHRLWNQGRYSLALALQSRISEVFHVDFHPAARIGKGVLFDHATGVVVGETATIGDNVSILHHVTLGGTGAVGGDRHPKVGNGVLIGAGATLLGPITIGEGAKIGAGSVVLTDIPAKCTAVGNPARLVEGKDKRPAKLNEIPSVSMDHTLGDCDYVI